ncbi:MAG: hypothetical protein ACEY3F_03935 [Wolbachia sp.]
MKSLEQLGGYHLGWEITNIMCYADDTNPITEVKTIYKIDECIPIRMREN